MLREYPVRPGRWALAVEVARRDSVAEEPGGPEEDAQGDDTASAPLDRVRRERQEHRRERLERLPPSLRLDTALALQPGEVVVVTYDQGGRRLMAVAGAGER
jgi:hypothetical protein